MLKKRLIPILLVLDGRLVKTKNFSKILEVGDPIKSAKTYSDSDADELIILNIDRDNRNIDPILKIIKKIREQCFLPISYGGGVNNLEDVKNLIINGADKVVLNTCVFNNYNLIKQVKDKYGSQSIIISVDVKKNSNGKYQVFSDCGKKLEKIDFFEHAYRCVEYGAGEIFINSIDRDGTMEGGDLDLLNYLSSSINFKIIFCGGVGNFRHLKEIFDNKKINAVGCASLFNFGDNNPIRAKQYLMNSFKDFKLLE